MKKILLFILALVMLLSFASCMPTEDNIEDDDASQGTDSENDGGGESTPPEAPEGLIYSSDVSVVVIKCDDVSPAETNSVCDKICELTGKIVATNNDQSYVHKREIVLGDTAREISKTAKYALIRELDAVIEDYEKKEMNSAYLTAYAVYSTGKAVALVWGDESIKSSAIEYFVNKYLQKPQLLLQKGFIDVQIVDTYAMRIEEENAAREAQYEKIWEMYGDETAEAVAEYLDMFDERYLEWIADLYDPGEYDAEGNPLGGGFYYSNSARDTAGYRIDIESTAQTLSFLTSSGLIKASTELKDKLPDKMQKEMVAFALSCQSPKDGYFYHPQWGENVQVSRISRDLGNAVWILEMFGEIPYWDTPSNVKGSLGAPGAVSSAASLTEPLFKDPVVAVSKVLAASGTKKWTGTAHLATIGAWEEYLVNLTENIRTNSYSIGNTVASQSAQIVSRDRLAIENEELPDADGNKIADGGYIETFERIFNGYQLENGLWEECSVEDGTVYYNAINGLMKISAAYNGIGVKMNNVEAALRAAAFMITHIGESEDGSDWADSKGKKPTGSVDVYNPWVAINNVLKNISNYYTKADAEAFRDSIIKPNALEMVRITTRKIKKFAKDDGSYGYTWDASPSTSQGAPASVPGSIEGDVNGGNIAFTGTFANMANALGFGGLKPFGFRDFDVFIERASKREHIKKDAVACFDGDPLGGKSEDVTYSGSSGSMEVISDPRSEKGGNVLYFTTVADKGNSINLKKIDNNSSKSGICLEWEMKFDEINVGSSTAYQIKLGTSYMFVLGVTKDGVLTVGDSSSTNGSIAKTSNCKTTFNAKEWNKFRVEYYVLNESTKTTAAKIYVNDKLVHTSSVYVGQESGKAPSRAYSSISFYALQAVDFTVMYDDVKAYDLVKKYKEETP